MYNVDVSNRIEKLIKYFNVYKTKVYDEKIDVDISETNIMSLKEISYILAVERVCNFNCNNCSKLENLLYGPNEVEENYNCYSCDNLKTLKGVSVNVGKSFNCSGCSKLENLEYGPRQVGRSFFCSLCDNLKEIKFELDYIESDLVCIFCEKLEYVDEEVVKRVGGKINLSKCKKVKNIKNLKNKFGDKIVNK